ncbi:MAG: FtsX-like permease family protein [Phycisphaerales bacterium]
MRAAWRLAISNLRQRRARSVLLILVIALSAVLISAVSVAMGSLRHAIEQRVTTLVGNADARIHARGTGQTLDAALLREVKSMPGVAAAAPRLEATMSLRFGKPVWKKPKSADGSDSPIDTYTLGVEVYQVSARVTGIELEQDAKIRRIELLSGRMPVQDNEIVIDKTLAKRLSEENSTVALAQQGLSLLARGSGAITRSDPGPAVAESTPEAEKLNAEGMPRVGDWVEFVRFGEKPQRLNIVGIASSPPLGGQPWAYMTIPGVEKYAKMQGRLSRIDIVLDEKAGITPQQFVDNITPKLPAALIAEPTERITSGFEKGSQANDIAFVVANMMAFIAAGFIIMTGLSTGITEKQRELAMLRCIGASRWQLAWSQLYLGLVLGVAGCLIGLPLGVSAAYVMLDHYKDKLMSEPVILWWRVGVAASGAILSGLIGASLPAWQASRVSPLKALGARAIGPKRRTTIIISLIGVFGVLLHWAITLTANDPDTTFYLYLTLALPGLMIGYFFLGVPVVIIISRVVSPLLEKLLRLPPLLLSRSVRATPYRFGFTSGAMMAGLALMVAIYTQGGALMRDWIGRIQFPDGFAAGMAMPPEAEQALRALPFVTETSSISLHPVETTAFGIKNINRVKTFFVAFDPATFFKMSTIEWVQGDEQTAMKRLQEGGCVIVANGFLVARGLGMGSKFTCWDDAGKEHEFEIVGVVNSPGLEFANNFFDVSADFAMEQRVHAVFGSRQDLKNIFNTDTIGLIQFSLKDDIDDATALREIRETLQPLGLINAGSGREIKETLLGFMKTTIKVMTAVAIFTMFVCCFGVANLVIAGVHARRYEFGVLRALGAQSGLLTRLVLAEAIIIAVAACILGTCLGLQGVFGGMTLDRIIWGIALSLRPPWIAIGLGCIFVTIICLAAAAPAAISIGKRSPRELLSAR